MENFPAQPNGIQGVVAGLLPTNSCLKNLAEHSTTTFTSATRWFTNSSSLIVLLRSQHYSMIGHFERIDSDDIPAPPDYLPTPCPPSLTFSATASTISQPRTPSHSASADIPMTSDDGDEKKNKKGKKGKKGRRRARRYYCCQLDEAAGDGER